MSGDQQTATKWMIRVEGSDLASVDAGQTVEIGRKPLRPLPTGDVPRIEILDDTRSMSKRHARFTVSHDGSAMLRDLKSTNGTYLVRPGDELVRLDPDADFPLTDDTVRLQFGDVPIDFVRFVDDDDTQDDDVANLFDYATDTAPAGHDAADMSVDDILNLRAGEPTDIFDASHVRMRATQLREAERQNFVPFVQPLNPVTLKDEDPDAGSSAPRDLFADAQDVAAGRIEEPAVKKEEFIPKAYTGPRHADSRTGDRLLGVDELARLQQGQPAVAMPARQDAVTVQPGMPTAAHADAQSAPVPEAVPVDAIAQPAAAARAAEAAPVADAAQPAVAQPTVTALPADAAQPAADRQAAPAQAAPDLRAQSAALQFDVLETSLSTTDNGPAMAVDAGQAFDGTVQEPQEDYSRFQRPAEPALEETQAFTPAFEPGSVFERVANGGFAQPEPVVEAGGYTSDQARQSDDFSEQFEMARQTELLPFLAMNPALYDDLYAWLAAQGNADIDHALARNPGYEDYRKAVGK